jgi:FkbM family methyltransferase
MSKPSGALWQTLRKLKWSLDPLLDKCGYRLERKGDSGPSLFSQLLEDRLKTSKEIVFVQIGANDGIGSDPIYHLIQKFPDRFKGLVVEPLKDKFELLKRAYVDIDTVLPVNMAVHNTEKEMLIHRVRPDIEKKLPVWARGIGSFNPEHHKLSNIDSSYMIAERVPCITFDDLLATHQVANVELLITDTEGYDFDILCSIDFGKYRPAYVHFEHGLSSGVMTWEKYKTLVRYLIQHGYNISHETSDTTAFLPEVLGDPSLSVRAS